MSRNLTSTELKRLHRDWRRRTTQRVALVVEGAQGPFNVGAMLRTAAAERVDDCWFTGGATTPRNPKVGKTALGADRYLPWQEAATIDDAYAMARATGYRIVAVELAEGAAALHELDLSADVALVVGHEDRGLSAAALDGADLIGYIPQLGKIGSLNVATAASVAIYEARRQAWATAGR